MIDINKGIWVETEAAINESKKNKSSIHEAAKDRMIPEVWPDIYPSFSFEKGASIFTMGSCFARNIEEEFHSLGFNIPTIGFNVPKSEYPFRPTGILNKYTPAQIYQEIEWAAKVREKGGDVTAADCEGILLQQKDGSVLDLFLSSTTPVTLERGVERRQHVFDVVNQAFDSDVIVLTLGLIESWFDKETGLCIHAAPHTREMRRDKGRYLFHVLNFEEAKNYVTKTIDLLNSTGEKKFLITTSPVPLHRTFTKDDVIVANSHSKSLLRSVCGEVEREYDCVDYFPSYEIVVQTKSWDIWNDDLRHVSDAFVGKIVHKVATSYCDEIDKEREFAQIALIKKKEGDLDAAIDALNNAIEINPGVAQYYFEIADVYRRCDRMNEAEAAAKKSIELNANDWKYHDLLGHILSGKRQYADALQAATEALKLEPGAASPNRVAAICYQNLGNISDAVTRMQQAVNGAPRNPYLKAECALMMKKNGMRDEGAALFEEALSMVPDDAKIISQYEDFIGD